MGGSKHSEIDKDVILDLFQIKFSVPAATSLKKDQKEMQSIPETMANSINKPEVP